MNIYRLPSASTFFVPLDGVFCCDVQILEELAEFDLISMEIGEFWS